MSEVERLAELLDSESVTGRVSNHTGRKAAAELRRLSAELEEVRAVLKDTGLLLHHFWCDVSMNDYSFEKLKKGMEAIDASMQKGKT